MTTNRLEGSERGNYRQQASMSYQPMKTVRATSQVVSETQMGGTNKYVTAHVQVYRISIIIIIIIIVVVVAVVVVIDVSIPVFRIV